MLKFISYDIVFQEIPDELTLAFNISCCPHRCEGCHSKWLWKDEGEVLDIDTIDSLIDYYDVQITCVCFMGGDNDQKAINCLSEHIKSKYNIKTAWYSGDTSLSKDIEIKNFDYIKLGPYIASQGGLDKRTTNQRLYQVSKDLQLIDITYKMQKH